MRSDGEPVLKTHIDGARNLLALNCETQMLREVVSKGDSLLAMELLKVQ